ncbi:T9SS type A sorting domain-containing protein [Taibaiella soli]|uniref:Secretion system C-terminal sorting domain-containing protein n=1 Tax=Taibaiella soli TaxID=1649169 RepID=A0A2W2B9E0_9BACT|nr:T9SS type A sorting domain-containing protein [Taibaiella soli]PZF72527.1 hypothetical protein DN068_11725 [Taibaiella soli]
MQIKHFVVWIIMLAGIGSVSVVNAQWTEMPEAPVGAYAQYFKYYNSAANQAAYISDASKAVVGIYQMGSYYPFFDGLFMIPLPVPVPGNATGTFIQTFRDDNKVCFCSAGHVFRGQNVQVGQKVAFDAYLKYYGKPSVVDARYNSLQSGYKTSFNAEVVADVVPDAILLLVDKDAITSTSFAMQGYEFDAVLDGNDRYFSLGHPYKMPQRQADGMVYNAARSAPYTDYTFWTDLSGNANNIGQGYSGAPVIRQDANNPALIGILSQAGDPSEVPSSDLVYTDFQNGRWPPRYSQKVKAIKIDALKDAIMQHCWKNRSRESLLTSGDYKRTVTVNNQSVVAKFQTPLIITGNAGLAAAADPVYTANNPGWSLLSGSTVSFSGFDLIPGPNNLKTLVLAKEINLQSTFSFTATEGQELFLNAVTIEATAPASRLSASAGKIDTATNSIVSSSEQVLVYPNPSYTGIFTIELQGLWTDPGYDLRVFAADGKLIHRMQCQGKINKVDISNAASGTYWVVLKDAQGKQLWSGSLICQHN